MDLTFNEAELAFRDEFRAWLADNTPADEPLEEEKAFPTGGSTSIDARRRRVGGGPLAQGIRRPRGHAHAVGDLLRGAGARGCAAALEPARHPARRSDDHELGHAGAEGALPGPDPLGRGDLVSGFLRARRRLRPGVGEDPRGTRRRRLGDHRAEGLDERGAVREALHAGRTNRHRRSEAQGTHVLHARHGAGRGGGRAATADHGGSGVQRGLSR